MKSLVVFIALVMAMSEVAASGVAKVSVLSSGKLLLNGLPAELSTIEAEFKKLQGAGGSIWYYRESAEGDLPPEAMSVMELAVKYKLPVSFSTKPDFSDYVDGDGRAHPRTP
jgi:hypothetical protein